MASSRTDRLEQEAKLYGAAGSHPQVVWSNGVLASTAVGLITQLLTPWYPNSPSFVFLDYDGNRGTVSRNSRMELLKNHVCPHHPPEGDWRPDVRRSHDRVSGATGGKAEGLIRKDALVAPGLGWDMAARLEIGRKFVRL